MTDTQNDRYTNRLLYAFGACAPRHSSGEFLSVFEFVDKTSLMKIPYSRCIFKVRSNM